VVGVLLIETVLVVKEVYEFTERFRKASFNDLTVMQMIVKVLLTGHIQCYALYFLVETSNHGVKTLFQSTRSTSLTP
jgi:hypothetical protein